MFWARFACSGLDWNVMLGLLTQLKKDKKWQDYPLICIGSYLGLRASDLLNLKWDKGVKGLTKNGLAKVTKTEGGLTIEAVG